MVQFLSVFQHCENLVQSLQARLLEAQQRLAVAQRVDSEKDAALRHLHSTWSKIMEAWNGLEEERDSLAKELDAARSALHKEKEQLSQKLAKCEGELSKALDLAHGYKEQSEAAERTRAEQLEQLVDKIKEVERRLAAATQANNEAQARETELREKLAEVSFVHCIRKGLIGAEKFQSVGNLTNKAIPTIFYCLKNFNERAKITESFKLIEVFRGMIYVKVDRKSLLRGFLFFDIYERVFFIYRENIVTIQT